MENIDQKIKNWIKETLNTEAKFSLEHPTDLKNGDYSTNISLVTKTKPEEIVEKLNNLKIQEIEKIEIAGPGFINFFLNKSFFSNTIKEVLEQRENYGKNNSFQDKKIMVEYTDPNPFKEFHIGHLMSNSIGEAVSRLIESQGANVKRANWQGDVGIHIAKAIWGKKMKPELTWGEAYSYGAQNFEENKEAITELNKKIYDRSDDEINKLYDEGRKESLDKFERIYERLGTKFDHYFFESKEGVEGKQIVEVHIDDGIFEKSEGAVIFRGEKYNLHTRVFINSNNIPTYEAKELGLNKKKFEIEPDLYKSIIVTGNEIKEYFKVLLKVISLIYPDVAEKTFHLPHGMLRLPTGKMSSRTGDVITAESLIQEVKEKVEEKIKDRNLSEDDSKEIVETVAIGAIKYSILRQSIGGDIIFDFDKSISFEGDSGPYLQYTYTRARSVLKNAEEKRIKAEYDRSIDAPITSVERELYKFKEVVDRAANEYAPHYLVTYLTELAGSFNSFYGNEQIVNESDELSSYKIALTEAVSIVLKNGLNLLGIKTLERM